MSNWSGPMISVQKAAILFPILTLFVAPGIRAQLLPVAPDRMAFQIVGSRSFLGVGVAEIDEARNRALNLKEDRGVEITRVESESPAEKAGLQTGDVVVSFNGQKVFGIEQFARLVRETPAGRTVTVDLIRGGKPLSLPVVIGVRRATLLTPLPAMELQEMPPEFLGFVGTPDIPKPVMAWSNSSIGVEGEALQGQLAEYFGVKEGVLVRAVASGSPAAKVGIRAGDVIVRAAGQPISSPREITSILRNQKLNSALSVQLIRSRKELTVEVPVEDPAAQRPRRYPARTVKN